MNDEPECPECDKLLAIKDKSQTIGFFLDWLKGQGAYYFDETSIEKILANYFNIDLEKVNEEQTAVLEYIRSKGN